ncbi:hypothetical protein GF314_10360 [bacterium]|nr:hypothetical protein [bacterium]
MIRHLILATLLVAGLAPTCVAAADSPSLADREGRSALVFGFNGEWLSQFDDAMFAWRKQVGERTGLRLGLSLGFGDNDLEVIDSREDTFVQPDTTLQQTSSVSDTRMIDDYDVEIDLLLLRHAKAGRRVSLYYGLGPSVAYDRAEQETASLRESDGSTTRETGTATSRTWRYGALVVAGVEWFITDSISLHGEYRAGVHYRDALSERESRREMFEDGGSMATLESLQTQTREETGWRLDDAGARFGVSVFF